LKLIKGLVGYRPVMHKNVSLCLYPNRQIFSCKIRTIFILVVPSPDPPSTRNRSKTSVVRNNKKNLVKSASSSESVERQPIIETNTIKKGKKTSIEINPNETAAISTTNKRKNNPISTIKKGKRRLHSVEQDEGLNTADEEETIQTISLPIETKTPVNGLDLNQEEREKVRFN
jgi:hypothetical protein